MYVQARKLLEQGLEENARDIYLRGRSKKGQPAEDHAAWTGTSLTRLEKGIPQGSPVLPILANLFLDELDEELLNKGYKYVRYADDFVILCKRSEDAKKALQLSKQVLGKLLLTLDEEEITSFDQGFKYLGVYFVRSLIMKPFDRPKREHKVLNYPKPLDLEAYFLKKKAGSNSDL